MIRAYFLQVDRIDNRDVVRGIEYMHLGILGVEGTLRKLTQDTTDEEHDGLIAVAESWRDATPKEVAQLATLPEPTLPSPDELRAKEIIGGNPHSIPATEMWELLDIITKKLFP